MRRGTSSDIRRPVVGEMKAGAIHLCIVGFAGAIIFLMLGFVWEVRARALLAIDGHLFVRFVSPTNAVQFDRMGVNHFVARVVYKGDEHITDCVPCT